MTKILKLFPADFELALKEFRLLYPDYVFPSGINKFVQKNCNKLDCNELPVFDF